MPFQSQAQRAWMYANHPGMARRWEAVTPKGKKLPGHASSDSRGLPPKKHTAKDDFRHLVPGPKARHTYSKPAKEQDSMEENGVQFMPGSRGHHLNKKKR